MSEIKWTPDENLTPVGAKNQMRAEEGRGGKSIPIPIAWANQNTRAHTYVMWQLQLLKANVIPRPAGEVRAKCEEIGIRFHDKQTLKNIEGIFKGAEFYDKLMVRVSWPEGWYIKMPDESDPRKCFWFDVMDQKDRRRFHIYFNANPHPERLCAEITLIKPFDVYIEHESDGPYHAWIVNCNEEHVEDIGKAWTYSRYTKEYSALEAKAQEALKKYPTEFED